MRHISLTVVALLLFSVSAFAGSSRPGSSPSASEGASAPDFTLPSVQGGEVSLSDLRGKIVFLNFWATWCPPCRAEMPSMERLHEVFEGKDFAILAVNTENDPQAVKEWLQKNPYTFQVLLDTEATVQNLYRVYQFPETFIIGRDGKIIEHFIGAHDYSSTQFLQYVDSLIKR